MSSQPQLSLSRERPAWTEYIEVLGLLTGVTLIGYVVTPVTGHLAFGLVYLLAVIALSLRVGRWPVLFAGLASAIAWDFVLIPPRFSFRVLNFGDGMMLGTYCVVALVAGQLTARIRAQEREERVRERHATALFHLTRAMVSAQSLDQAVSAALRQAEELFGASTALVLIREGGALDAHPAGSFSLTEPELAAAKAACETQQDTGRFTSVLPDAKGFYIPMIRAASLLGVFALKLPSEVIELSSTQRNLIAAFAAQIALLLEREQLRAASEREHLLAESEKLHRTLLDSISHELKTPLAVLSSSADKLGTSDENKRLSLTNEIRIATQRLNRLVANLLNQTRLESGALTPRMDWCNVRDLLHAARRDIGAPLTARPFTVEIPPEMPLLKADAALMEQVVSNLLLNAVTHTPPGTTIRFSSGIDQSTTRIFIAVTDEGPGLPAELRANPFQKFKRADPSQSGGVGLGLSIVRGFVTAQGGEVVVEDNPGGGAVFKVYLPYVGYGSVPQE